MTVIDLVKITTELMLNSLVGRTASKYFKSKKDLKDLTANDLDFPRGTKMFVNLSLCPCYRILWSKTKRLQSMGKRNSFFISGRTVKIETDEKSNSNHTSG